MTYGGRNQVTIGDTTLKGPVNGQRCPACGNTDSIFKEIAPDRVRMRCGHCNCQFPGRAPGWVRYLASSILLSVVALAATLAYQQQAQLQAWVLGWWQRNPLLVAAAVGVTATGLMVAFIVAVYPSPRRKR